MESQEKNEKLKIAESELRDFEEWMTNHTPTSKSEVFYLSIAHLMKIRNYFDARDGDGSFAYHRYLNKQAVGFV